MRGRRLPGWCHDERPGRLRADVIAGLTVWAVVIPESLAYASIAGVSPVIGLYAAVPSLLVYALLGSSRHLIVAPMSATAALSATVAATHSSGDAADYLRVTVTLALVVGVVGALAGLLRLGFLSSFISQPVLKGFIIGLALSITLGQIPPLLGIEKADGTAPAVLIGLTGELPDLHPATAAIGVGSLVLLLSLRRMIPALPGALVVVAVGIALSSWLDLAGRGVGVVGSIEAGLPSPGLPGSSWHQYLELTGPAAAIVLVGFVEGLAASQAYALRGGYPVDTDRELVALGGANLGAGLLGGMVVNGSLSKTAVNGSAGARTQLSGVIVAVLTTITLLLLTGLFEELPDAVLAAIVIAAVIELIDLGALGRLYRVWTAPLARMYRGAARADFLAAVGALVGVLILDVLPGLLLGVGLSLLLLLYRASHPHVARLAPTGAPVVTWVDAERRPELTAPSDPAVLRVEGALFFANADHVHDEVRAASMQHAALVLDLSGVAAVDVTAAEMLTRLGDDLTRRDVRWCLAEARGQVRDVLTTVSPRVFTGRFQPDVAAAVRYVRITE